jgi:Secretion system C-terminal sorting domain
MRKMSFYSLLPGAMLILFFFYSTSLAQIPNAGFENWTDGVPDGGWQVTNVPGLATITQSTSAHGGSYALEGTTASLYGQAIPAAATIAFPFTQRPGNFGGFYKFSSVGGDSFSVTVGFSKNGTGIGGYTVILREASSYTQFILPILWVSGDSPDTCIVGFQTIGHPSFHEGTTFYVDDISFDAATGIEPAPKNLPAKFALDQNFPNPFNPTAAIRFTVPSSGFVSLKVYDVLGKEVRTLVNKVEQPGSHEVRFDATGLPSGIYFYRLRQGTYMATRKLAVLK